MVALRRGDIAAATDHMASRSVSSRQFADVYARAETATAQAQITEARNGPVTASGHLRQFCADLPGRPGLLLGDPAVAPWLVRITLAAGEEELATIVTGVAQGLADAHPGIPALAAASAHNQGLVHRDPDCLAEAVTRHPDPWARASAAEDLGVLYGRRGDPPPLDHTLRPAGDRVDSLTGTDQAVASLVAQWLNNKEIAARMYISTHTVAHHLRQTFRKLHIASRVELARIVIELPADASLPLLVPGP